MKNDELINFEKLIESMLENNMGAEQGGGFNNC